MGIAKKIADKINVPTKEYDVEDEKVSFAQLSIADLAEANESLDVNLWETILDVFSADLQSTMQEMKESGEFEKLKEGGEIDNELAQQVMNQKAMVKFVKSLDYKVQTELSYQSLKVGLEEQVTKDQADKIFSYGLNDQEQMEVLMFVLQGASEEEVKEKVDDSKNLDNEGENEEMTTSPSTDEE